MADPDRGAVSGGGRRQRAAAGGDRRRAASRSKVETIKNKKVAETSSSYITRSKSFEAATTVQSRSDFEVDSSKVNKRKRLNRNRNDNLSESVKKLQKINFSSSESSDSDWERQIVTLRKRQSESRQSSNCQVSEKKRKLRSEKRRSPKNKPNSFLLQFDSKIARLRPISGQELGKISIPTVEDSLPGPSESHSSQDSGYFLRSRRCSGPVADHQSVGGAKKRAEITKSGRRRAVDSRNETINERDHFELGASGSSGLGGGAGIHAAAQGAAAPKRATTRHKKGHQTTTGSCASSGGGGAAQTGGGRLSKGDDRSPPSVALSHMPPSGGALLPAPGGGARASADHSARDVPSHSTASDAMATSPEGDRTLSASGNVSNQLSNSNADSESEDSEVGRLQALLEARGLPPHLFGALGPRMQHLLHRSMGSNSSVARAQSLLPGLQASGDEGQQLQAVIEMCQLLVMGNEEVLTGFPVKQVVPALIDLLQMEHNFDIMNHACRALTYMMEALPRSSSVVVDAVPIFLEKLQVIQCMDVAEQSLTALDMLSRRHSKSILQARGVSACLTYLDFFPISAQRNAFSVTANCCLNLAPDEFQYVQDSLPLLASRLTQPDKKCAESVCLTFSRLVDSFQTEPQKLAEIASFELLTNLQRLLVLSPPIISSGTFITVLRMLSVMCANCPDLALALLKQNIAETLSYLLTGSAEPNRDNIELVPRQPQELYEITCLIGELMPKLPSDGIFSVNVLLERAANVGRDLPVWQWRDDRGWWHPYSTVDGRIIENAHQNGDDEVSLNTLGRIYTVDFHSMQQINEDSGTSRPVQRLRALASDKTPRAEANATGSRAQNASRDARVACLREERGLAAAFIRSLFSVLYEVYSSSAGPAVRHKCLKALLRMVYYANAELLKRLLKSQLVSSHLAGMLACSDLKIVVGALQMADILIAKMPDEFGVHFRREGVIHQVRCLANADATVSPPKASYTQLESGNQPSTSRHQLLPSANQSSSSSAPPNRSETGDPRPTHTAPSRLGDVLKRKRPNKRSAHSSQNVGTQSSGSRTKTRQQSQQGAEAGAMGSGAKSGATGAAPPLACAAPSSHIPIKQRYTEPGKSGTSFLQTLNPARWGRNSGGASRHSVRDTSPNVTQLSKSTSNAQISAGNREKTRLWIREQAGKFIEAHANQAEETASEHSTTTILGRLKQSIKNLESVDCASALVEIRSILIDSDVSPFELNHSGLIDSFLTFLTDQQGQVPREHRLRIMLNAFADLPLDYESREINLSNSTWLSSLVSKLNGCVSQLEQFPVKVHDLPAGSGSGRTGTSALKFFNTHQLKCSLQRHPDCTNLKQWKGGTVKIDPLALVQAIERYLIVRGYGRPRDAQSPDSDEADSDTDIDEQFHPTPSQTSTTSQNHLNSSNLKHHQNQHKLQFSIGLSDRNVILPYNMTVYQAIRQFSSYHHNSGINNTKSSKSSNNNINSGIFSNSQNTLNMSGGNTSETDTDGEMAPLGSAGLWVQTHVIYYRPVKDDPKQSQGGSDGGQVASANALTGSRKGKGAMSNSRNAMASVNKRKTSENQLMWLEGRIPTNHIEPLESFLLNRLPSDRVTVEDASLPVLCLLRVIYGLNMYWHTLYARAEHKNIVATSEFMNAKIAAKASRQLQDPLVIMTGNLPTWLHQIATVCPFLFPFDSRQLLFYVTSFDRDRALQRLLDTTPELSSNDSQERVTPRLDRRKRTISRDDILKQAEQLMQEMANSKALLEIQYENEVGTGLGPTLEFYALVSRELQKQHLKLWYAPNANESEYVHNATGLFPAPLARNAKSALVARAKSNFRFIGKLMAKAVMDSRMLDLPFSLTFYRWLLGYDKCFTLTDVKYVNPDLYVTLRKMEEIVRERDEIIASKSASEEEKNEKVEKLTFDGCLLTDLGLDFILPGTDVELMKNGRNIPLTIHNLHLYVQLLQHWMLNEGVGRQMEALRDGFDSVFPSRNLRIFRPDELEMVFCGSSKDHAIGWDVKTLMECCRPDHGYTADSKAIRHLFEVLSSYDDQQRRKFVQFLTGSPRLPVGGFKSLSPPLTVVRKTLEPNMDPDDYLPSVMTCVNYLKLPDYSTIEVMRAKLQMAANEGQHSFHLS